MMVEGSMSFDKLDNGLHTADFLAYEHVEMEAFGGQFKVQVMRSGDVYMTELPKRIRQKPLFRQDNSSLSLGRDGMYYYVFRLPADEVGQLPAKLVKEAKEAAAKVQATILKKGDKRA